MADNAARVTIGRAALAGAAVLAMGVAAWRYWPASPGDSAAPAANANAAAPDVGGMVKGLEDKLRANPKDTDGWRMLGLSYFNMNRFPEAAKAYAHAAELKPGEADLWSALGEALVYAHRAGVDADATHAFERALADDQKDARARYFLAVRKDMSGDHKGAIDDWIALLKDTPPGAPWEHSVRELVKQVADREKVDISGRLPAEQAPPAAAGADAVATGAIPGPTHEQMADAARLSPTEQNAMAQEMVARLAGRLAANPNDADGWIRLMRARLTLDDRKGAEAAYASGRKAFAGDGATLARLDAAKTALGL